MFHVRVYNRQDGSEIMRSDDVASLDEAIAFQNAVGQGEGYYSIIMEPRVTLETILDRVS